MRPPRRAAPPGRREDLAAALSIFQGQAGAAESARARLARYLPSGTAAGPRGDDTAFWSSHRSDLQAISTAALVDALEAGDAEGARQITCEYWERLGRDLQVSETTTLGDEAFADARRVLGAVPALRALNTYSRLQLLPSAASNDPAFIEMIGNLETKLEELRAVLRVDTEAIALPEGARGYPETAWWMTEFTSLPRLEAALRAALRDEDEGGARTVGMMADAPTFAAFCERHRDHGVTIQPALRSEWRNSRRVADSLHARADVSATIDGRQTTISLTTPVMKVRSGTSDASRRRAVVKALTDAGVVDVEVSEAVGEVPRPSLTCHEDAAEWPHPERSATEMLGRDRCDHEGGRWLATPGGEARLECPGCLRAAVVAVPAHRLPPGHEHAVTEAGEEAYLALERARASVFDDPRPIVSLAQLRDRDGFVSTRPADHATGRPVMIPGPRAGSLASALTGARRARTR